MKMKIIFNLINFRLRSLTSTCPPPNRKNEGDSFASLSEIKIGIGLLNKKGVTPLYPYPVMAEES